MNVMMIRAKAKAESVSDMEAAADKMFAAEPPIVEPLTVIGSYELF